MADTRIISAAPDRRRRLLWGVIAAIVVVVILALLAPRGLAFGWLAGWLLCLSITTGAGVWLLIGALTGGQWVQVAGPALVVLSRLTPIAALGGIGFILAAPVVFPWWPGGNGPRQVQWLNGEFFAFRAVVVLLLWSGLGLIAGRAPPPLAAAMALVIYGLTISVAAIDWVLSLDPGFSSTAFGAQFALMQLTLAMAAVAVMGLRPGTGADVGGLLLACVLGCFYVAAMEYIVSWTGNMPGKAGWYVARQHGVGSLMLILSFLTAALGPFCVLIVTSLRGNSAVLRWVGVSILLGGLAQFVWLVAAGAMLVAGIVALAGAGAVAAIFLTRERRATRT